jgi:predicted HTH transcriptional regulator
MGIQNEYYDEIHSVDIGDMKDYLYESSLSRIKRHSDHGFFTLSAFRSNFTEQENLERHNNLKKDIRSYGLGYIEQYGRYVETEDDGTKTQVKELSLFVPYNNDMSIEELKNIAKTLSDKYHQESYILCDTNDQRVIMYEGSNTYDLGIFDVNKMGEYLSLLKKGFHGKRDIEYVFEGITVPSNVISRQARSLGGEIF